MKKDFKKKIRFVMTVGNKEKISEELEKRSKNPTVKENKDELEKNFPDFKRKFEDYDNSEVYSQYMTNKTGKYLVYCINYAHMLEMIKQARQMFSKVNTNINITHMGKDLSPEAKKSLIKSFEEDNGKEGGLNLLFINKATMENFHVKDLDGVILFYSSKRTSLENDKLVNQAFDCCLDNGVVIQLANCIDTIGKVPTLKKMLNDENKFDIQFYESDSFEHVKRFRKATYSRKIDEKYKLKLMQEYKKETGEKVSVGKRYKGYYIGSWKNNLRQKDSNNELEIDSELRKEFEKEGILGDRQRRERTSDEDKYNLLMNFKKENPNEEIKLETVDKDGRPIGYYRAWLQTKFNTSHVNLTKKQIQDLRKKGILYLRSEEAKKLSQEFDIPESKIDTLLKQFGSLKRFIIAYKTGKTDNKGMKLNKRGIVLNSSELSIKQKQHYINLVNYIFGEGVLEDKSKFVIEKEIVEAIEKLDPKRKMIIERKFGLNGFEPQIFLKIAEEFGVSRQLINEKMIIARKKLSNTIKIYSIQDLIEEKEKLTQKLYDIENTDFESWKKRKLNFELSFLGIKDGTIENLNKYGYKTVGDMINVTREDLECIPWIGDKKIRQILREINIINNNLAPEQKENEDKRRKQKIELRLQDIDKKIEGFKEAYSYYMEQESITSKEQIIPPIMSKEKTSKLTSKKQEKQGMIQKIEELEEDISLQDEKSDRLHSILEISEETVNKEEN